MELSREILYKKRIQKCFELGSRLKFMQQTEY
jgi:hypothetical protein